MNGECFRDRPDAGRRLAGLLDDYRDHDTSVVALARGEAPLGHDVPKSLDAPLDVQVDAGIATGSTVSRLTGAWFVQQSARLSAMAR